MCDYTFSLYHSTFYQEDVKYREKDQSSERSSANRSSTCSEDGNYRKSWRSNSSASITSTGSAASWTVGMSSVDEVEESPQVSEMIGNRDMTCCIVV